MPAVYYSFITSNCCSVFDDEEVNVQQHSVGTAVIIICILFTGISMWQLMPSYKMQEYCVRTKKILLINRIL